jgi:hypothetical protein
VEEELTDRLSIPQFSKLIACLKHAEHAVSGGASEASVIFNLSGLGKFAFSDLMMLCP